MNLFLSLGKRKEALVMIIYHHLSFFLWQACENKER